MVAAMRRYASKTTANEREQVMANAHNWMTGRAIQIVAEDKLRAAIEEGQFEKLPGFGRPHPIFDEEYDPHWWIRRKLAREALTDLPQLAPRLERSPADESPRS